MLEEKLTLRTLRTSAPTSLAVTATILACGHRGWAAGFLIGSALSLFSLFSLTIVVPMLMRPGAPRFAGSLLGLTLFMKLPLYFAGLYAVTHIPGISAAWAAFGIGLTPTIITLKTVGRMIPKSLRVSEDPRIRLAATTRAMVEEASSLTRPIETKGSTVFHPRPHVVTASERG